MAHRIRLAMQQDDGFLNQFSGICEVDETYVAAKVKVGAAEAPIIKFL